MTTKLSAAAAMGLLVILAATLPNSLLDLYKTGRIVIEPDPSFGKSADWRNTASSSSNPSPSTTFSGNICPCTKRCP